MSELAFQPSIRPGIYLQTPENAMNPYPAYAMMREHYPVCQLEPHGAWPLRHTISAHSGAAINKFQPRSASCVSSNRPPIKPISPSIITPVLSLVCLGIVR